MCEMFVELYQAKPAPILCPPLQDYFGALQDVHALRSLPAAKSGCTALRALLMDVQYTQMEYDAAGTPVPELQALEAQLKELIPL